MGLDVSMGVQVLLELVAEKETLSTNLADFVFGTVLMLALLVGRHPFDGGGPELKNSEEMLCWKVIILNHVREISKLLISMTPLDSRYRGW